MGELYVFSRRMEVQNEIATSNHRIKEKTGNVMIQFFLFCMRRYGGEFCFEVEVAFTFEEGGVDCEMYFIGCGSLVAVEEGGQFTFSFAFFPHFGYKDSLPPELHEIDFSFGRVEEQKIDVHRYFVKIITINSV